MSGVRHTPGPWEARRINVHIGIDCPHGTIGYALGGAAFRAAQQEADARLFAAGPEMLEALEEALNFLQDWEDLSGGPAARKVRAAIAKATGAAS